ncbi:hypothetical protein [Streptosporangium sp. NBC_01756]|uniref:hypothetical protein n=1 Tax=Streptosporangium sp. NBC_01756 TaxID=2975950 RepID=UPI002DD8D625|nr:hypothetical protein [Streptosporangium sp. NBC_01756]WSC89652.1 hypothetical protein OIE48_16155 [Streptosporangium sp. NBC_01756]
MSAEAAIEWLKRELEALGIVADTHHGDRVALLSVWVDLVVWCDGHTYWWRVSWNAARQRATYARHPATEPGRAARRIAFRYAELRETHPLSEPTAEATGDPI